MFRTIVQSSPFRGLAIHLPKYQIVTTGLDRVFTQRHIQQYQTNGATLVENVLTHQEVDDIIAQNKSIVDNIDILQKIKIFLGREDGRGAAFLETGDKIDYFFEENVFDKDNKLLVHRDHAINKIGHAMHDLDPNYERFSYQPLYKYILEKIGYKSPTLVQSMYIYKNPKVGGEVRPHTDNQYLITEPKLSTVGFWFALHDATIENGCMWGVSGSQKEPTQRFFLRNAQEDNGVYEGEEKEYQIQNAVPLEVKKGSMLVFHGDYVHYSFHNKSSLPRHAITLHFVETDGVKWAKRNWLKRNENLPFRDYNKTVEALCN